jgi:hypothetical protein
VPETTETTVVNNRDQVAVFRYLADFGNLAEWDPTFDESSRLDSGELGVGSRFRGVMSFAGNDVEIEWTLTHYDEPNRVVLDGASERFTTQEDIRVEPVGDGTQVTYTGRYDTDASDLLDAASKPAFFFVGKAAIRGMNQTLNEKTGGDVNQRT